MPNVLIDSLEMSFADRRVVHGIDLEIKEGEFFTFLGPSGCGKTTTLNGVAGLLAPTAGRILVGESALFDSSRSINLEPEERNLGMVFQSYALWPHMTVMQNLEFPLKLRSGTPAERKRKIGEALDRVGLSNFAARYPHELSGGQQQRVALARALVYSPSVLLLDEPLSNLDAKLRVQARSWLKELQSDLGITTIYVTHDQEEALSLSDRIGVMFDGRFAQVDTPAELYERPQSLEVASFIGSCGFLAGAVSAEAAGLATVRIAGTEIEVSGRAVGVGAGGATAVVAVRPERISVSDAPMTAVSGVNSVPGTISHRSYLGSRYEYTVRVGENELTCYSMDSAVRDSVFLEFSIEDARVFPSRD